MVKLPSWIYWTLAASGLVAALIFTITTDASVFESSTWWRLMVIVWGGPLVLLLTAIVTSKSRALNEPRAKQSEQTSEE